MLLETLKRGLLAHLIKFRFTIIVITCLLLAATATLIGDEYEALRDPEKTEALETLCQLPHNAERHIAWGYVGSYRLSPGSTKKRVAFWWDNIDHFLSNAPDVKIAEFASLFTNPTIVAILRQLVEGKKSVADLAKESGIPESEVKEAVEKLMKATLVIRTENNLIKPHNDAISFFLNFVSMTTVHLGHIKSDR